MNGVKGTRVYPEINGELLLSPGDFGEFDGIWYAMPPGAKRLLANLKNHDVTENEDGTITVSPSILVTGHDGEWHGYLENGIWREC